MASGDADNKSTPDQSTIVSYKRLDGQSTVVLSNCSSEADNDEHRRSPILRWKREAIVNHSGNNSARLSDSHDAHPKLAMPSEDNTDAPYDGDQRSLPARRLPPIPADKLHRRNPNTVRRELQMLEDFVPDTDLVDIQLNEMPGLQDTEQWKRIAGRTVHSSPPLSRQYYQNFVPNSELQDGQVPQSLGSYRRPGRSDPCIQRLPRRRICLGSFITVVIVAIVVAVVLAVTIVPKSDTTTTDYYEGSAYVHARFIPLLEDPSSAVTKSYKREFCSLIGTTLADTRTKYAIFYSTCTVTSFRNGSIIADFVLGFTQNQDVSRLSWFLNRTLASKELFGGNISWIVLNPSPVNPNGTNATNSTGDTTMHQTTTDLTTTAARTTMAEQNSSGELQAHQQPSHTSYTTVTYTTLEKGLSITISETITITNSNLDQSPINAKNYEVILIPNIENGKTVVVPATGVDDKVLLPPPATAAAVATANRISTKSSSQLNLLRPIRPITEANFAYIDASSDDRTYSSEDGVSTLGDMTTQDSTTTQSTTSLSGSTLTDSNSTLANNITLPTSTTTRPPTTTTQSATLTRTTTKAGNESSEERQFSSLRMNSNAGKRLRRWAVSKNQRRLLQYELMPTGKVYYIDRPFYNDRKPVRGEHDDNSSAVLSTILSRSSSVDTLSDKRRRHHQSDRKHPAETVSKPTDPKLSVGVRLASNSNLVAPALSSFRPVNTNKKNRFSSFEPTDPSLDQVFDVLIAADKRREEHDFWKERFEPRPTSTRPALAPNTTSHNRSLETTHPSLAPAARTKTTQPAPTSLVNNAESRSQSFSTKRTSLYDAIHRQSGCLLEDCLRRRTQIAQQKQPLPPPPPERNYSPNTVYSTNYPKQHVPPAPPTMPTTTAASQPSTRFSSLPNGRAGRAPQARQTSDELSSTSDVWAARSTAGAEAQHGRRPLNPPRAPSAVNRSRVNQPKAPTSKRALSAEQQKSSRPLTKSSSSSTKSKFFDLFKFTR